MLIKTSDWQQNQLALQKHLQEEPLDNFLRWSTVEKTMFVGDVGFVHKEYSDIVNDRYFKFKIIIESKVGNPKLMAGWTSGNLIHQYYHLKQWLDRSDKTVQQLENIVEIGAGYGAMALIIYRLGFKGRYTIIDLPESTQIQQYYLSRTLSGDWSNIFWLSTLPSSKLSCNLFIACHSLSEMPLSERERLLSQVDASAYLFASSYEFEGVDNQTWLQQFAGGSLGYDWAQWPHPYQENAFYQVGVEK